MNKNVLSIIGAIFLPSILTVVGSQSKYMRESIFSNWPISEIFLLAAVISGIVLVSYVKTETIERKIIMIISIYLPFLLISIFFSGLLTACFNGDCL